MELKRIVSSVTRFVWLTSFILLLSSNADGDQKCSRTLSKLPVHKDFNTEKFLGTWYTVSRTTWAWGEKTYHSFSIEFKKQKDDAFQFSFTGQLGNKCLPVVSGVMTQKGRPGMFLLKTGPQDSNPATLIVSFTDYKDLAMVYYCFKYRPGTRAQCQEDGMQVEIISRSDNPNKKEVNAYVKRASKRLCATAKDLQSTRPGQCKIPEILQKAKDMKKGGQKTGSGDKCAVNNIQVQSGFSAAQLQGLWYEIARTRFTFNKMESVVNYQIYDETSDKIYSHYTGTVIPQDGDGNPKCMTAIRGMSKTAEGAAEASDRLGRIGWDDSTASAWSPTKVLYADDDYTLFYACYAGPSDNQCVQQAMEVTLAGRKREISAEKRDAIYSILPSICVNPADMVETQFLEDCASWVIFELEKKRPEDCRLDDIKAFADFDNSQLIGSWYLYASITNNNATSLRGMAVQKVLAGATEVIDSSVIGYVEADTSMTCNQYRTKTRDMCVDTGDHISTFPLGDGNFVFTKVLYLDDTMLVQYTCLMRTVEGTCDKEGAQFHVYTKNDTSDAVSLTSEHIDRINSLASDACLDPNQLQLESEWCNKTDFDEPKNFGFDAECDIDTITIFSDMDEYIQDGIYGYWYEVSRSQDVDSVRSTVAFFTSGSNETLIFTYTGPTDDENGGECAPVQQQTLLARCRTDANGDYLKRYSETETYVSYVPFKIIYTDYSKVLVTYSCGVMIASGQCSEGSAQLRIWSRNHTLDEETREYAYEMAFWACLNPYQEGFLQDTHHENDDCRQKLEDFVVENALQQMEGDDDEGGDDEDDSDTQGDQQGEEKYSLSDIEAVLNMDDDEFYADT